MSALRVSPTALTQQSAGCVSSHSARSAPVALPRVQPALPHARPSGMKASAAVGAARVRGGCSPPSAAAPQAPFNVPGHDSARESGNICTSITARTVEAALEEIVEGTAAGADILELRIDFIADLQAERDLPQLLAACTVPCIVTYRPDWEGGNYEGPEEPRVAALKLAAELGAPFIDVEFLAADALFANGYSVPDTCKVILSNHDYKATPELEFLKNRVAAMWAAGADIVKLATTAEDVSDSITMLNLIDDSKGPMIMLSMGERGQPSRLLAGKYGGLLTFGALSKERASAPGQPDIGDLGGRYRMHGQSADTKVFGIIGNPVSHSRSPAIHNAAMQAAGFDGVYVPFLVDELPRFLKAASDLSFAGFSVTIPHKEAALAAADEVDPVAAKIGAVNTLIRQPDGTLKGYNTDWSAAIDAVERGLAASEGAAAPGALEGRTVVVIGAGGAGRALAFGAASRGARVIIANRSVDRAQKIAAEMDCGVEVVALADLQAGKVSGDALLNTTSVGMHPYEDQSPVPAEHITNFKLVFDAIYTPMETVLLKDAKEAGCAIVSGVEMFVGQAVQQYELFTGGLEAPEELMTKVVVDDLTK